RTLVWLAAWHMIRDHPVWGIGLDQFLYHYSTLYTSHPYWITALNGQPTQVWREPTLAHPHNLVLDLWLSAGLLGLVGFAVVVCALGWRCMRLWREWRAARSSGAANSQWVAVVAVGVMGSVLASLVHGMVDSAYFVPDLALLFWWSVGLALLAGFNAHGQNAPQ
ncbi:MAG TPA: O-antigen ligase family protein, partial [Ktedonobacterales bacterium]